jgi:N-acylglucosamine-6-phosphate 2-epimerase
MNGLAAPFPASLNRRLIVSCQAAPGDPLDDAEVLRRLAISTLRGGAGGLRACGAESIAAMRRETSLPIIGIQKRYDGDQVYITPDFASACAVSAAGADVVALDCTARRLAEREPWPELIERIHGELRKPVLADIATFADAVAAVAAGADAVATTLFGFTPDTSHHRAVSWTLVEELINGVPVPVIVEGHITSPEEVRRAFDLGAYAAVVGSAITRPEAITSSPPLPLVGTSILRSQRAIEAQAVFSSLWEGPRRHGFAFCTGLTQFLLANITSCLYIYLKFRKFRSRQPEFLSSRTCGPP